MDDRGCFEGLWGREMGEVERLVKTNRIDKWDVEWSITNMYAVVGEGFRALMERWGEMDIWGVTNSWVGRYLLGGEVELEVKGVLEGYRRVLIDVRKSAEGWFVRKVLLDDSSLRWYSERGSAEYLMREEVRKLEVALSECPNVEGMSESEFEAWKDSVRGKYIEGLKKWDELFEEYIDGLRDWICSWLGWRESWWDV